MESLNQRAMTLTALALSAVVAWGDDVTEDQQLRTDEGQIDEVSKQPARQVSRRLCGKNGAFAEDMFRNMTWTTCSERCIALGCLANLSTHSGYSSQTQKMYLK